MLEDEKTTYKLKAMEDYSKKKGISFDIWTEKDLGL